MSRKASFSNRIRPIVNDELETAREARAQGDALREFNFLERAHVLGQASTREHVRVHILM
ncbi:MAG: DUF3703 domain-containing protein, partial [Sinobacteraceae bacterium]|nr:DUF3703 domain-containing protein [Nevskiaceae bacterium]